MNKKTSQKRKFKITLPGLLINVSFSFMVVVLVLFYFNNFFLRNRVADNIERSADISKPSGATHFTFTEKKNYYSYVDDGKLVVKKSADNSEIDVLEQDAPVVYSFTLDDRDLIMYFTYQKSAKKNLSASLNANTGLRFEKLTASLEDEDVVTEESSEESEEESQIESEEESAGSQSESDAASESENTDSASESQSGSGSESGSHSHNSESESGSDRSSSDRKSSSSSRKDTGENNNVGIEVTDNGSNVLTLYTYDIDKNESTKHKSFTVRNFSKINQVEYSTLTNLIYVNAEVKNGKKVTNNIYRINIVGKIRVFSSGFEVDKIAVLKNSDTVFYQRPDNTIYRNGYKFSAIKNEPKGLQLLGIDNEDNVYFKSLKNSNKVYRYTVNKKVETIDLSDFDYTDTKTNGDFSDGVHTPSGFYLIYKNKLVNIAEETPVEVFFTANTSYFGVFADTLYMIDGNNLISYKNLR